jgi:hypothetical protein
VINWSTQIGQTQRRHAYADGWGRQGLQARQQQALARPFQIGGHWVRVSTAQRDLEDAKRAARERYLDYKFREKHGIPMLASSSKMWRTWPLQACSGSWMQVLVAGAEEN